MCLGFKNVNQHAWFQCSLGAVCLVLFLILTISLSSCTLYSVNENPLPSVEIPATYSNKMSVVVADVSADDSWWKVYHDVQLNTLINTCLSQNYSLRAAWNRLEQTQAQYQVLFADTIPQVELEGEASRTKRTAPQTPSETSNSFQIEPTLSYEVDLWNRKASFVKAGEAKTRSSRADYENTALVLTGRVTELVFRIREQKALLNLLEEQRKSGQTLLELTELRFRTGQASALEIYQQRQQLESTLSNIPEAESQLMQTLNLLATLSGLSPSVLKHQDFGHTLPNLPQFPALLSPANLLESRPDLRALKENVTAAEFDIASAMAAQLPSISLSLSYGFQAGKAADLLDSTISSLFSNLTMPLFDAGANAWEIDKFKAASEELKNLYTEGFLTAFTDVENSIIQERYQVMLLEKLETQMTYAKAALREARERYVNGLSTYLEVLVALQSVQGLERRVLSEQRQLITSRNQLYLALGGKWTKKLSGERGSDEA